jgi:saccharopine dehydrogenase-like NADP-dependent oxidoreductase
MIASKKVAVFGAYGHTGKFVIAELHKRGLTAILSGRDATKLAMVADGHPSSDVRVASMDDPDSLDRAISGAGSIINCAGPFVDTVRPVIDAAIRSRIPYLDLAAEQAAVLDTFVRYSLAAKHASLVVIPAMAFYGGLADLLATAAMSDWVSADEILIAVALDSWKPTRGTRLTGQRNPGKRFIFTGGKLERGDPPARRTWNFPAPFGQQDVEGLSLSEAIAISRHLQTPEIRAYMNLAPLADIRNADTPPPTAADESGRSAQLFLMEAVVRKGASERRMVARGRDIYASSAPIVVEAAVRVMNGLAKGSGVLAAGEAFDAESFLQSLGPDITIER